MDNAQAQSLYVTLIVGELLAALTFGLLLTAGIRTKLRANSAVNAITEGDCQNKSVRQ